MNRELSKGLRFGVWLPLLLAGLIFFPMSVFGSFTMRPDIYGRAVVSVPAEIWAGLLLAASTLYIVFMLINGRWRHSVKVRLFASFIGASKFAVFAVSAVQSAGNDIVVIFGFVFVVAILVCVGIDTREAVKQGRVKHAND